MIKIKKLNISLAITSVLLICFMILGCSSNVFAAQENTNTNETQTAIISSIFDVKGTNGEYKVSDEASDIYLPFFRNAVGRVVVDKSLDNIGIISSASTIDVNEPLKNIQFLFSSDSVRINNQMEYCLAWSGNDVVINSNVDRNMIIFAGGKITVSPEATIGDDVILVANSVDLKGTIKGSAVITAPQINLSGVVEEDLRCEVTSLDISSNDNIKGNIYINTYNKDINVKDKYPNAVVNVKEAVSATKTFGNVLLSSIITCLAFTLLYLIIKKVSKGKAYEKMLQKAKNNTLFVVLSGSIYILSFPAIFIFLIVISFFGIYMVTVPLLIIYTTFLIVFIMLATYILGSTIFEYMNKKYIKAKNLATELVGVFFTYLSLTLLTKIPTVGSYIAMAIMMLSVGLMFAYYFKKNKEKELKK